MSKKAFLIVNLGTPDDYSVSAVRRYLKEFLLDKRVIDIPWISRQLLVRGIIAPFRAPKSAKAYAELWTENGSPLKVYGESVVAKVQEKLGEEYDVRLAMRYQKPAIGKTIDDLLEKGTQELVVMPLFPQYSSATTGSIYEEVMDQLKKAFTIPSVRFVGPYFDHPLLIESFAQNGRAFDLDSYDHILFSYHGLPERQLVKSDVGNHCQKSENCCRTLSDRNQNCYSAQCFRTTALLADALGLKSEQYTTCFQSRLGRAEWVKPYTEETIKQLAAKGVKRILVFCPAFVADCLETTIEIGDEYHELFMELGGEELDLVPSLNDNAFWIDAIPQIAAV